MAFSLTRPKAMNWSAIALSALTALAFLPGAIMKTSLHPMVLEGFAKTGIPDWAVLPLGILELGCLVLFLLPRTALLGTLLLTGYLGGAMLANLIHQSDLIHVIVVGMIVWAAAWARIPEFRAINPFTASYSEGQHGRPTETAARGAHESAGTKAIPNLQRDESSKRLANHARPAYSGLVSRFCRHAAAVRADEV